MSSLRRDDRYTWQRDDDWSRRYPAQRRSSGGPPWGLLITGAVVVGLGAMALRHLLPDLQRYIKIERM